MTREQFLIEEIKKILAFIIPLHTDLRKKHPIDDVRVTLTGSSGNILHCYQLHLEMAFSTLCQVNWWKNVVGKPGPDSDDKNRIYNLDQITKFLYFVHYYSQIEWNCRIIMQSVKSPTSKISLLDKWKNIYSSLFKIVGLSHYEILYDIARQVRNAIHNNGYYLDPKSGDIELKWKGKAFKFENGKQINFATHENILYIAMELAISMADLINSGVLKNIPYIKNEFHINNPH